jgi:hypothetical protein
VNLKPGTSDVLWMLAGAATLGVVLLLVLRFHSADDAAAQVSFKAKRIDLVAEMRLALAAESEAEKTAVMAITDEDSQRAADEARRAIREIAHLRDEFLELSRTGDGFEIALLARFSDAFAELVKIDEEILTLAVKNTNLKASRLAFGPAAQAVADMESALARAAQKCASSPNGSRAAELALEARAAALRVETLLPPHIAEESDARMDALEAGMEDSAREARVALEELAVLDCLRADPDLELAAKCFAQFAEMQKQILALSRENTNVRSTAISLDAKRKAMFRCQESLDALQQAISKEPIVGVDYARPSNPRGLGAGSARGREPGDEPVRRP